MPRRQLCIQAARKPLLGMLCSIFELMRLLSIDVCRLACSVIIRPSEEYENLCCDRSLEVFLIEKW